MIKKTTGKTLPKTAAPISEPPKRTPPKTFAFLAVIVVVVLTAFALMAVNAIKGKGKGPAANTPAVTQNNKIPQAAATDVENVVSRVSQLILTKNDEQPTVATVQDADLLRQGNPLFYKDAENGDRLLVWSDKAVLYSTKQDKLLAVMPIAMNQQATGTTANAPEAATSTQVAASTVESEKAAIEVRNGTMTAGLAKKLSTMLKDQKLDVQYVTDAKKKDYTETVVYKLTDKPLDATVQAIVKAVNAKVVDSLPAETGAKGDVLVVVGQNFQ